MRRLTFLLVLVATLAAGHSQRAAAHPHAWIDLRTTLVLDDEGRLVAMEQEWLFDEFYSVFATDGWDMESESGTRALTDLARGNLENLFEYNYFTEIKAGDETLTFEPVLDFETEMKGGRIWMRFTAPLKSPVDVFEENVSYRVFDPTYYVEILHMKGDIIAFRGPETGRCTGRITVPTPTMEAVSLAQSLPPDAEPDDSLGRMFAERVDVECR
ncbi:MAG: DUF1007 family protein [Alphaproteobacteria bacterium]